SDRTNAEFVQNAICVSEIRLPHDDTAAKMRQTLGYMPDCVRILIQRQNIGATFQKGFGGPAAPTCSFNDQQACFGLEQFKHFALQPGAMVDELCAWL